MHDGMDGSYGMVACALPSMPCSDKLRSNMLGQRQGAWECYHKTHTRLKMARSEKNGHIVHMIAMGWVVVAVSGLLPRPHNDRKLTTVLH